MARAGDLVEERARPVLREADGGARPAVPSVTVPATEKKPGRRKGLLIVTALVLIGAVVGGIWWYLGRGLESTDDAFVDGEIASLAPRVGGTVLKVLVDDNQHVAAGQVLVEVDPADYQVAVESAQAGLAAAEARAANARADLELTRATAGPDLQAAEAQVGVAQAGLAQAQAGITAAEAVAERARADATRYQDLAQRDFASRQRFDQAQADAKGGEAQVQAAKAAEATAQAQIAQAQAQRAAKDTVAQQVALKEAMARAAEGEVAAAKAALDQARLNLSYTKVTAPAEGWITKKAVQPGDVAQKDQTLASLVFGAPYVTANFKETQLGAMRPGQPVELKVDAYPGLRLKGHVDSVQRGTGARFSLMPPENATGNYVKVVQRVPVKIVLDEPPPADRPLSLGMSVVPTVRVADR